MYIISSLIIKEEIIIFLIYNFIMEDKSMHICYTGGEWLFVSRYKVTSLITFLFY